MKQKPYRLHAAAFNSLRTIQALGGGSEIVVMLKGGFSRTIKTAQQKRKSEFIKTILNRVGEEVTVDWHAKGWINAKTVDEILMSVYKKDGIPDVLLRQITFAIAWIQYSDYTMKNETMHTEWAFNPFNFKPGVWKSLKASDYPGKRLYDKYVAVRNELRSTLDDETKKRWRDTLLMNKPHKAFSNQEVRQIWTHKPWVLVLKETRGKFELMDLGEVA